MGWDLINGACFSACMLLLLLLSLFSRVWLYGPMDCSPPGFSVHGILQARILEGVVKLSSRGSFWPRDQICISCTGRRVLYHKCHLAIWATKKREKVKVLITAMPNSLQLCGLQPPGSSLHGILQARILEWVAIPFSRGFSQPRDRTQVCIAGRFFAIWATRFSPNYQYPFWKSLKFPNASASYMDKKAIQNWWLNSVSDYYKEQMGPTR